METRKVIGNPRASTQFHQLLIKNLKTYRKKRGYSQMKLAQLCSVSPNYIGEIEMGRKFPSADTMDKIIFALNLKPYQLFFSEEDFSGLDEMLKDRYDRVKSDLVSYVEEALRFYESEDTPLGEGAERQELTRSMRLRDTQNPPKKS
ncbi:helix-turn-helix transcriptional regulator [Entomospira culicis]|uniref:Helix-turn-helix transcriptional regulator n=1 Tax=Entomospira culicis TaxID=2719989 RepID=A0A968KWT2_9SPIO|nr:helix-turn-helix transcriptional regulator [Entomospira culicis]NIZ19488.1 helix-turn-helix transcriptional regulator [Entomospira culicis]NIZ69607.1 helix-turn-helix transcriptional regulator [Entomospira culicis]WDI36718.1 helix-turn-helix transcriptional regulator [Entomospira culicis]WDI38347.1 helix-turn-helix transcriptional regulator [Entomospira culicis]